MDEMWAGFEVWNSNDQMGGAGASQHLTNIGWSANGSSWTYFSTLTLLEGCCSPHAWKSWWSDAISLDSNSRTDLSAYTIAH